MSVEWYTPARVFEAVGLRYDLDPCAPALDEHAPAVHWADRGYRRPDDGLLLPWEVEKLRRSPCRSAGPYGSDTLR